MREDDDSPDEGSEGATLADGLGEIVEPNGFSTTSAPYGDVDPYDEESVDATTDDDTTSEPGTASDDDPPPDADDPPDDGIGPDGGATSEDGNFGEGEPGEGDAVPDDTDTDIGAEAGDVAVTDDVDVTTAGGLDGDLLSQDASPLEGLGYIIDELRDALLGDDEAATSVFDPDPVDLETDTDLDLNGDGIVDQGDLHEAESPFDFGVDPHPGG